MSDFDEPIDEDCFITLFAASKDAKTISDISVFAAIFTRAL